jgi:hypothetical protein
MQTCQIITADFPKSKKRGENLIALELIVFSEEFERLATHYGNAASMKMIIDAWVAGTGNMPTKENAEVAALLHGLAKRFQ